ncbi:hypothetical protein HDU98_008903 [Podochytrium sp. JEL0797]|nr:hypothetical protein HDU98_008903 [Podochytrium sp. JEL0797]
MAAHAVAIQVAPSIPIFDSHGNAFPSCAYNSASPLARLEPPLNGQTMLGMSLDWSYEVPTASVTKMNGYIPAVFNAWLNIVPGSWNGLGFDNNTFNWFGSEAGKAGAILELTLLPMNSTNISLDITVDMMTAFAKECQIINQWYGVPIFLRYAHEMNGDWYPWGNYPSSFIASFRQFTTIMRQHTNMTAMVWAPNIGIDYPFTGAGARESPVPGGLDFAFLDTNKDGKIDIYDDPYTPFYPGDDVVDWVGLSLYYYPNCTNDCPVPAAFFEENLTGLNNPDAPTTNTSAWNVVHNFYAMFPEAKNKPMMLPETGSPWIAASANRTGAVSETQIKQAWWAQLLSQDTLSKYPKLKLFVQFEEVKALAVNGVPAVQDWRVTNNTQDLVWWNGFVNGFSGNLKGADELVYACDGSVAFGTKAARVVPVSGAATVTATTKSSASLDGVGLFVFLAMSIIAFLF